MPTKTISLDEEAYERLRADKRAGESFSDVVKRLVGERSWREVAGIWSGETDDVEAAIERGRERSQSRSRSIPDGMEAVIDLDGTVAGPSTGESDPLLTAPAVSVDDPVDEDEVDDVLYDDD